METTECEIWMMVDADGDYAIGKSEDEAAEKYDEEIGGHGTRRLVKVVLTVPTPVIPELRGTVPVAGEAGLSLAVA